MRDKEDYHGTLPSRLEDAAEEILHTLCRVSASLAGVLDEAPSPDIATAVIAAYKEIGDVEDEDALEATAIARYMGHDPETRA